MALVDRALETATTTGTGDFTLAGAVAGFRTLNAAIGLSLSFPYTIEAVDASSVPTGDWEVGEGHLSGTTTLVRRVVMQSSNAGALVSFAAGTKRVFIADSAHSARTAGQLLAQSSGLAMP
jgi:hypothetical protein